MDPNTKYGRVIPNFIKWGIAGKPLVINGDGTQERSFCHVADLIECLSRIISNKTLATRVLNVGCRETIKILELAQLINKLTGNNAGHTFDIRHKYEPSYRTPNIDRAKAWLDWSPKVRLKDGLEVLIALNRGGYSQ
jgi:nucleoside-diphosphate-sugar epimerase